jgi:hypothetical protein
VKAGGRAQTSVGQHTEILVFVGHLPNNKAFIWETTKLSVRYNQKLMKMDSEELKNSSERIGQLYPILVDKYGHIIDGEHRLVANPNWKKVTLEHINTEKDLLVARIACNTIRRNATSREKTELLEKLGQMCINEGTPVGKVAYELMYQTGMSYRWVAKYLPKRFKNNKRAHNRKRKKRFVARHATTPFDIEKPPKDALKLCAYHNTDFVNVVMEKRLFKELEKKAAELESSVTDLLYMAIVRILKAY